MSYNCKEENKSLKGTIAGLTSRVNILSKQVQDLLALSPEATSHQIVQLWHPDDLANFDLVTGLGAGKWLGWGVCNGATYNVNGTTVTVPNLTDKVPVGGGNLYVIGDVLSPKLQAVAGSVKMFGLLYVMKLY